MAGILAALGLAAGIETAGAGTIAVTRCNDQDGIQYFGYSLRMAIDASQDGDTVDMSALSCSTITLERGELDIFQNWLTIVGPANHALSIDAHDASRVANHSGTGNLYLRYLTLTHGIASAGSGGCVTSNGQITLAHSSIGACQAANAGGGINANSLVATYSSIEGNLAGAGAGARVGGATILIHSSVTGNLNGGGLNVDGTSSIYYSTISSNQSTSDGAGLRSIGSVKLVASAVYANVSAQRGGGIFSAHAIDVQESALRNNQASGNGGGLYNVAENITLTDSTVSHNQSGGSGGGAMMKQNQSIVALRSTIDSNIAITGGGTFSEFVSFTNSTISGNHALAGGGIATVYLNLKNSTVAFNRASGTDATSTGGIQVLKQAIVTSSIIADNGTGGTGAADLFVPDTQLTFLPTNSLIVSSNRASLSISSDAHLAPLAYHGGLTRTHALLANSAAVDAGNNNGNLATDGRDVGYPRVVGVSADIGAYERQLNDDEVFYDGFD